MKNAWQCSRPLETDRQFKTMRPWLDPPEIEPPVELVAGLGVSTWIAGVLARRGLDSLAAARGFLDPDAYLPTDPQELPGLVSTVDRLQQAIQRGDPILVWGDFDVDGQTSTAVLVDGLRDLGGVVSYHIPIRAQESHGVSLPVLRRYLDSGEPPKILLTCDTGITAFEAAEFARSRQVDMVITDHHELARQADSDERRLPNAGWIITPRFLPAGHPLASLPGVGVAFKLIEALYQAAGRQEAAVKHYDLVALGIVADVAYQSGDARYLLQRGLEILRSKPRPGLQAIYERAELNPHGLSEEHIAFTIAPRLNALGRLGDANPAVDLLTTTDRGVARLLALQLEGFNARRQLLTNQVLRGALAQLKQDRALLDEPAIVLANPAWEAGVIGIVASRLVELYGKPVVLISAPPGEPGRASARSVEGLDITKAIASQSKLLLGFGGHAMAAGFSISEENIPAFQRGLNRAVAVAGVSAPREGLPVQIDAYLPWEDLSLELVEEIEYLAPFGPGNPVLVLASREVRVTSQAALGREQAHLMLTVENANGLSRKVIWWGGVDDPQAAGIPQGPIDLAFQVRGRTYRGVKDMQIELVDYHSISIALEVVEDRPEVEDYRQESHPMGALMGLLARTQDKGVFVWVEGLARERLVESLPRGMALRRYELSQPLHTLVIWTAPPSASDLRLILSRTHPKRLVLIGLEPEESAFPVFISRLAGLARYILGQEGRRADLARLAAATAQREMCVLRGLEWMMAQGYFSFSIEGNDLYFETQGVVDSQTAPILSNQLKELLEEARAYRSYFRRVQDPLN